MEFAKFNWYHTFNITSVIQQHYINFANVKHAIIHDFKQSNDDLYKLLGLLSGVEKMEFIAFPPIANNTIQNANKLLPKLTQLSLHHQVDAALLRSLAPQIQELQLQCIYEDSVLPPRMDMNLDKLTRLKIFDVYKPTLNPILEAVKGIKCIEYSCNPYNANMLICLTDNVHFMCFLRVL